MTSQLSYFIAQQRQAALVSRAEQARLASEAHAARSAPAPRWDPAQARDRSPSLGPATRPACT
jgi:hypothetical protein